MKRFLVFLCAMLLFFGTIGNARAYTIENWTAHDNSHEVEFGITSIVDSFEVNDPWVFEIGYSGAWWFNSYQATGQTFSVASDGLLSSVTLRLSSHISTVGQFEIAVWDFDSTSEMTTNKLAYFIGDASYYQRSLSNIDQSVFDMSEFNAFLDNDNTYMISLVGLPGSEGNFYLQSAVNLYDGGSAYSGDVVPEPATMLLFGAGLVGLAGFGRKKFKK